MERYQIKLHGTKAQDKREMFGDQTLFGDQTFYRLDTLFDAV